MTEREARQQAIDRAYVIACSALDYHALNQNPQRWDDLFRGIVETLQRVSSRGAAVEAQQNHDDAVLDAASW